MAKKTPKKKSKKYKALTSSATPKGEPVTREVELGLDDPTRAKLAAELGTKLAQLTELNTKFAEKKAKHAEQTDPLKARVKAIENFLECGREKKTLQCTLVKNYDDNVVEYWYEGRVVDHRAMSELDRQQQLDVKTKRGRSKKNSVKLPEPTTQEQDIANVRRLETGKFTKRSAVDGPTDTGPTPTANGKATQADAPPATA